MPYISLGEASVGDLLKVIPNPTTCSSVRKMLSLLEEKGLLKLWAADFFSVMLSMELRLAT